MSDISVSLASAQVTLSEGRASVTASVTNGQASAERVVLGVYAAQPAGAASVNPAGWTTVERPLREIGPGATEQYVVSLQASDAPSGTYDLKVIAYPADRAPEEYADRGQALKVVVPPAAPAPPPPKRPWWIFVLVAVLVLVIGGIAYWLTRPPSQVTIPDVTGLTQAEARERLADAGITGVVSTASVNAPGTPQDVAVGTEPGFESAVPPGDPVLLVLATGLVEIPDNLVGFSDADAEEALNAIGLAVSFTGGRPGSVTGVSPTGLAPVDATVTLTVEPDTPPEPPCTPWPGCILPDLPILEVPDRVFIPQDDFLRQIEPGLQGF